MNVFDIMGKRKRSGSFSKSDDPSGTKRSDAEDSQEELDAEIISGLASKGGGGGSGVGVGIRCSARVQEKQEKLRRESSPSKQILPLEVNCSSSSSVLTGAGGGGTGLPSSNVSSSSLKGVNNVKYPSPNNNNNNESASTASEAGVNPQSAQQPALVEEKRKKRTWELWSLEDKQMFFEALNEHGKDFDAIQNYLASKAKSRKSGTSSSGSAGAAAQYAPKNKDQVRHFYYRTWNKISKYLRYPDGMKKVNQELYGLINYGELRKKQRILNSKTATKLCELVENGMTSIKFRGKTCRIKTPVCRALKRLNGLDDVEHSRVPHKVSLEFIPKDGKTWRSVQGVSHNPRVKVVVSLQRTFASIISYMENKWKGKDDRLKEQFSSVFGKPRARLRMIPADRRGEHNIPLYRVAENTSSATICLRSYKKNVLICEPPDENELNNSKMKRKRKQSGGLVGGGGSGGGNGNMANSTTELPTVTHISNNNKRLGGLANFDYPMDPETSDAESQSAVLLPSSIHPSELQSSNFVEVDHFLAGDQSDENAASMKDEIVARHLKSIEDYNTTGSFRGESCAYPMMADDENNGNGDLNFHLPTETEDNDDVEHELDEAPEKFHEAGLSKPVKTEKFVSHLWDEERVRRGWTAEETGVMTIGELYLMLGQTDKLSFEYCWDSVEIAEGSRNHGLLEKLITTATLLRKKKTSRSKAGISNSMIKCGSHLKCSTCGLNVEIPPNPSCASKPCSATTTSATGSIIVSSSTTISPLSTIKIKLNTSSNTNVIMNDNKHLSIFPPTSVESASSALALTNNSLTAVGSSLLASSSSSNNGPDLDSSIRLENSSLFNDPITEPSSLKDDHPLKRFDSIDHIHDEIIMSPVNGFSHGSPSSMLSFSSLNSTGNNNNSTTKNNRNNGLIELCSLVTNPLGKEPTITATLLPPSSCMIRNPSGTISVVNTPSTSESSGQQQQLARSNKTEQLTFHRPSQLRNLEPAPPISSSPAGDNNSEFPPPKPFLDLPKGNRRLGRKPNFKRVVIPRVLPLLPKNQTIISVMSTMTDNTTTSIFGTLSSSSPTTTVTVVPVRKLSIIPTSTTTTTTSTTSAVPTTGDGSGQKLESNNSSSSSYVNLKPVMPNNPPNNNNNSNVKRTNLNQVSNYNNNNNNTIMRETASTTNPRKCPETITYEMFLNGAGTLSCNSNDFEDLLKVKRNNEGASGSGGHINSGDVDSLSLSSFMEISLPESAKLTANEMNMDDLDNSNISLNMMTRMEKDSSTSKDLITPDSSPMKRLQAPLGSDLDFDKPWSSIDGGDLSLSNFFHFDSQRSNTESEIPEGEVNFQTILDDGSLDFSSKLTELTSPLSDDRSK